MNCIPEPIKLKTSCWLSVEDRVLFIMIGLFQSSFDQLFIWCTSSGHSKRCGPSVDVRGLGLDQLLFIMISLFQSTFDQLFIWCTWSHPSLNPRPFWLCEERSGVQSSLACTSSGHRQGVHTLGRYLRRQHYCNTCDVFTWTNIENIKCFGDKQASIIIRMC